MVTSMTRDPCVYIMASASGTLYTGVTRDVYQRVFQHRNADSKTFAGRYRVTRLVWFEKHESMRSAILREKQIKGWRRSKKIDLIEQSNASWSDLAAGWYDP
jgi:putative endonuclease